MRENVGPEYEFRTMGDRAEVVNYLASTFVRTSLRTKEEI